MPNVRILLQARLNSSRLPGKMLLPINGNPLIVLCANRAQRSSHSLKVITSEEGSDDILVETLKKEGIEYYRGPLDDVLARFIRTSEDMDDDDLIIRLTGDNPYVDADFINSILNFHQSHGQAYSRSLSPQDGFPYGLSAEVITVRKLREIAQNYTEPFYREHVTIALTECGAYELFQNTQNDLSHLRATVDTFEDYIRVNKVFRAFNESPLDISWQALIEKQQALFEAPKRRVPYRITKNYKAHSFMALGSAQLGTSYGIANQSGQPSTETASDIVGAALNHGVTHIDTAAAYGNAEQILGCTIPKSVKPDLAITTKLSPFQDIDFNTISDDHLICLVQNSVYRSLKNLGISTIPTLLLHRADHLFERKGLIWDTLLDLRDEGLITGLGVSVQTPDEAKKALEIDDVSFIQHPFNIMDWRWWNDQEYLAARSKRSDVHIQVRSVLLQGLLTLPTDKWPLNNDIAIKAQKHIEYLIEKYQRKSVIDLCYAYVSSQEWISTIVVGMDSQEQLLENVALLNEAPLPDLEHNDFDFSYIPEDFLNPATWS